MKLGILILALAFPFLAQAKIDVQQSKATSAFSADQDAIELVKVLKDYGVRVDRTDSDSGFVEMAVSAEIGQSKFHCGGYFGHLLESWEETWQDDRAHTITKQTSLGLEANACDANSKAAAFKALLDKWDNQIFAGGDVDSIVVSITCDFGTPVGQPAYQDCFVRTAPGRLMDGPEPGAPVPTPAPPDESGYGDRGRY